MFGHKWEDNATVGFTESELDWTGFQCGAEAVFCTDCDGILGYVRRYVKQLAGYGPLTLQPGMRMLLQTPFLLYQRHLPIARI